MATVGGLEYTITCERRQAMVAQYDMAYDGLSSYLHKTGDRRAFVWPMPTSDGMFVVEYEDGRCSTAKPHDVRFLDSKGLFDQYEWEEV